MVSFNNRGLELGDPLFLLERETFDRLAYQTRVRWDVVGIGSDDEHLEAADDDSEFCSFLDKEIERVTAFYSRMVRPPNCLCITLCSLQGRGTTWKRKALADSASH